MGGNPAGRGSENGATIEWPCSGGLSTQGLDDGKQWAETEVRAAQRWHAMLSVNPVERRSS